MKSRFNHSSIDKSDKIRLYELSLQKEMNEGQIAWHFSQTFLLANTVIIAFIAQGIFGENALNSQTTVGSLTLLTVLGFFISLLWFVSYRRRTNYYKFRVAQARQREPKDWNLVAGDGQNFSSGDTIEIEGKPYSLGLGAVLRPNWGVSLFILIFMAVYPVFLFGIIKPWRIVSRTSVGKQAGFYCEDLLFKQRVIPYLR